MHDVDHPVIYWSRQVALEIYSGISSAELQHHVAELSADYRAALGDKWTDWHWKVYNLNDKDKFELLNPRLDGFFFFFLVLHLSYLPTVTWYSVLLFSLTCLAKAKNCYTAWPIIYILLCKFTTALSDLMNTKNEKNFPFILIVRTVSYWVEQLGTVNVTQSNFTQRIRNNNKAIKTSMKQIRKRKDLLFY